MNDLRFWADFNEVYDDNRIWLSVRPTVRRTPSMGLQLHRLVDGEWVELWDDDGNTCAGVVQSFEFPILHLKMDLTTWRTFSSDLPDYLRTTDQALASGAVDLV